MIKNNYHIIKKKIESIPEILKGGIITFFLSIILVTVINFFSPSLGFSLDLVQNIFLGLSLFFIITILWSVPIIIKYRKSLDYIIKAKKHPIFPYMKKQIKKTYETIIKEISGINGAKIYPEDMNNLTEALFESGRGEYIGVESNLPSTYFEKYPNYLDYHKKYLQKKQKKGARILIAKDGATMYDDSIMNATPYRKFVNWHKENKVELLWIDRDKATNIKNKLKLESTDIGLWKKSFAALFKTEDEYINVKLLENSDRFKKAKEYIENIVENATKLELETTLLSDKLVKCWDEYVGDISIRHKTIGSILLNELKVYQNYQGRILDAAAGMGYEGLFLLENNFDVTFNEADLGFNEKLKEKIEGKGYKVDLGKVDWRDLSKHYKENYKAVLVLGNSLCMLSGEENRKKCIEEFHKILSTGGKLIIDLRNFSKIEKKIIEDNEYIRTKKVMYNGKFIDFKITKRDDKYISFDFFKTQGEEEIGNIPAEMIKDVEFKNILKKVGFKIEKIYSDFQEGYEEDAEIYTYIAIKVT